MDRSPVSETSVSRFGSLEAGKMEIRLVGSLRRRMLKLPKAFQQILLEDLEGTVEGRLRVLEGTLEGRARAAERVQDLAKP